MSTTLIDINEKLGQKRFMITIHQSLPREAFWHEYAKHCEGDFYWIFANNCEGTEQLRFMFFWKIEKRFDYDEKWM